MNVPIILSILIRTTLIHALYHKIGISRTSAIDDAAIDIIKSCVSNKIRTVGITAPTDYLMSKIILSGIFDVIVMENVIHSMKKSHAHEKMSYKLHNFVINAYSANELSDSLESIKSSIWWNFQARFIIIEKNSVESFCKNSDKFLRILWEHNITNGIVICLDSLKKVTLYGFNPYNRIAPAPWTLDHVQYVEKKNDHAFSVFKRFRTRKVYCNNIFFKEPKDLEGYPITANMKNYPPTMFLNINRSSEYVIHDKNYPMSDNHYYIKITSRDWNNFQGIDSVMAREFMNFYNITAIIKIYDSNTLFGAVNKHDNTNGMLKDQKDGKIDIGLNNRAMHLKGNIPLTYPFQQSELSLVTHTRGDRNILMRIITFFNSKILISIMIICLLTIFFFAYFIDNGIQLAVIDTLQLLLEMSLYRMPFDSPSRIFLICLIYYYFIISQSLRSNMYAIVTVPQSLKNVDSLADLQDFNWKLYTSVTGASFIDPEFYKHLHVIKSDHCIDRILTDSQAGCIDDLLYLKHESVRYGLHIMKESISSFYLVYPMRKDWPMSYKLNILNEKFNEAGILKMLIMQSEEAANNAIHVREQKYKLKKFETMTLSKCNSILFLWLVGIIISIIVYFIELQIFKYNQKNFNNSIVVCRKEIYSKYIYKLNLHRICN